MKESIIRQAFAKYNTKKGFGVSWISRILPKKGTKPMQPTTKNNLTSIIGIFLFAAMIGLTIYALKEQKDIYESLTKTNDLMIRSTEDQAGLYQTFRELHKKDEMEIARVSKELETTQKALAETQDILTKLNELNVRLQQQMAAASATRQTVEEGASVPTQPADFRAQLESYEAQDLADLEHAENMMGLLKEKIHLVRVKVAGLKRETRLAKIAALKEQDRLALQLGNRGFLLHNGRVNTPQEVQTATGQKVDINVRFYEE